LVSSHAHTFFLHLDPLLNPSISVNGLKLDSMELCGHLIRLFDLPWWKRTWTVQEFVLAQRLVFQCSRSLVTRETMYMARENFWSHKDRCCPQNELDYPHPELGLSLSRAFEQPARLDFINTQPIVLDALRAARALDMNLETSDQP
jgi:hypothetical protein